MNLNRLSYFVAVVDAGSFTRAAERLGITKAVVSQQVAQLEAEVGTTLLIRSTRKVLATEAGRQFHDRCVQILREAEEAFDELAQAAAVPRGTLRVAAPADYGTEVVVPVATDFAARYPQCHVSLLLGDAPVDLGSGAADISIRVGWLPDSSFQARRIGQFRQLLVAGQSLAARLKGVTSPADLTAMPFVANHALREPLIWTFSRDGAESQTIRMTSGLSIDATPAVLRAVRGAGGLSVLPDFQVADLIAAGEVIHVLPDWHLPSGGIHTVYPAARFRPAKVQAFTSMLVDAERRRSSSIAKQGPAAT